MPQYEPGERLADLQRSPRPQGVGNTAHADTVLIHGQGLLEPSGRAGDGRLQNLASGTGSGWIRREAARSADDDALACLPNLGMGVVMSFSR